MLTYQLVQLRGGGAILPSFWQHLHPAPTAGVAGCDGGCGEIGFIG